MSFWAYQFPRPQNPLERSNSGLLDTANPYGYAYNIGQSNTHSFFSTYSEADLFV